MEKILVMGACGQIGTELTLALRKKYGKENVFASDIREENPLISGTGPYVVLDALDREATRAFVKKEKITSIYLLAALLSGTGEKDPQYCWDLNVGSLRQVLDLAATEKIKIFWPSSIAVFGATTPKKDTPQKTIIEPTTMYGITKYAGELLCDYYHKKFGVDVRSVRYPGLISWKSEPGGGTTDYAVEIFYGAIKEGKYTSFLSENTYLPMMYMDDAIRGTMELMEVPGEKLKSRLAYNLSSMSFAPKDIAEEIKKHIPNFAINYKGDFRQAIADGWPGNIDDSVARYDWGWKHEYDLPKMVNVMLENLKTKLARTSDTKTQEKIKDISKFTIRRYEAKDKEAVFALHKKALIFAGAYISDLQAGFDDDFQNIEGVYMTPGGDFIVGMIDEKVVAMGALKKLSAEKAEIKRMRVDPDFQKRGFGQAILTELESRARKSGFKSLELDTTAIQDYARRLYEKNGYKEFERRIMSGLEFIYYQKML